MHRRHDRLEEDNNLNTIGPIAFAAKYSLLQSIPHMLPEDLAALFMDSFWSTEILEFTICP
jgi:hypothetical protein